jgi:hypothetical protein
MTKATPDDDATIRLSSASSQLPQKSGVRRIVLGWALLAAGGGALLVGGGAAATWFYLSRTGPEAGVSRSLGSIPLPPLPPQGNASQTPPPPLAAASVATQEQPAPPYAVPVSAIPVPIEQQAAVAPPPGPIPAIGDIAIQSLTEAQIRDNVPTSLSIFRLAANPNIIVLDFASLHDQGLMLNRLGAFAEKVGLPHDRLLSDAELDKAIRKGGDTPDTFYYGHDYSAATIAHFFALADRDHVRLNSEEEKLHQLMQREGWLVKGKVAGLISIPRVGSDARVTPDARATILHHELSHGQFFSDPAYVAYTHHFWLDMLSPAERTGMRRYLAQEQYDPNLQELMENEAQAYIVFTYNPLFFAPAMVGMTEARRAELHAMFLRDVPATWMRDSLPPPAAAPAAMSGR